MIGSSALDVAMNNESRGLHEYRTTNNRTPNIEVGAGAAHLPGHPCKVRGTQENSLSFCRQKVDDADVNVLPAPFLITVDCDHVLPRLQSLYTFG